MPKKARELGPLEVGRLKDAGLHAVGGVAGLHLQVSPSGARSWVLRTVVGGRRRDMGLGGYPDVTLAQAREAARGAREKIRQGVDPIEEGKALRSALKAKEAASKTFEWCAAEYIKAKAPGWRNAKHAQQWTNTLTEYAYPVIGSLMVRDIGLPHILAVLEPIWESKNETASRVRSRMELVLHWATTRGYREGLNPARWRGHLDTQLAKPSKVKKVEHHAAIPVDEIGAFMQVLRSMEGMGARALEFAILTAARSGEVRGATWSEIDLDAGVWSIPKTRMKGGRDHRVPLSAAAVKLLKALPRIAGIDVVFPGPTNRSLSDMTLSAVMRRAKVDAVPHGCRSTFKDWASERTHYPNEMTEMALAHAIGDKTEAAYRRGDLFEKRRRMMDDWAKFIAQPEPKGQVIPMKKAARAGK